MSKILASKGPRGISTRYAPDNDTPQPGEVEIEPPSGETAATWLGTLIWDDVMGGPREATNEENLQAAKATKREELEARLDEECRKVFPSIYVGIIVMSEQKSDPRGTQIRALIANYNAKLTTLDSPQTDTVAEVEAITF